MSEGWSTPKRGAALRSALTAAAHTLDDAPRLRTTALALLRAHRVQAQEEARRRLGERQDGLSVARFIAAETDALISAAHAFTTTHVVRARNPTEGERLALVATGGYGRGALAPFSDVDLLFLRAWKMTPHVESVTEYLLYLLWDLGLKVGWASRSIDDCLKAARDDMTVRTAELDSRLITGDAALFEEMRRRFRREVLRGREAEFIAAKLKERDERHVRAGASRYMVEPDVKNGKGALRDLHTLLWMARCLDPEAADDWAAAVPLLTPEQRRRAVDASRFFWTVRCHLHSAAGRPEERLSFAWQPEIARRMGYAGRHGRPAAERLMRRYFLAAREVGALTRVVCAGLEARAAKPAPLDLSRFLSRPKLDAPLQDKAFRVVAGRMALRHADGLERDPINLLRLFRAADQTGLDLHPQLFDRARRSLALVTPELRRDSKAVSAFLDVLVRGRDPRRVLSLMNDAGVLGRFIPEWGRIVARTQFNMYHAYTVDEHTLHAVGLMAAIGEGALADEHALATALFPTLADPQAVFLAMLLHDVGKADPGEAQEVAGARAARVACERMGLPLATVQMVAWLVGHHLLMSDTAQKRDIADPETVETFAREVGDLERLKGLLILTVADIRAVGPAVWNGWKAQLLRDLYAATERVLAPRGDATHRGLHDAAALRFGPRYEGAFDADERQRHEGLLAALAGSGQPVVEARPRRDLDATELSVAAPDRLGLFADIVEAIAAEGALVIGARAQTSGAGEALDVFYLQDAAGHPYGEGRAETLARLQEQVRVATAPSSVSTAGPRVRRPAARLIVPVEPRVSIEAQGRRRAIVEVTGADRPGLLADLSRALARCDVSIASAHVETLGERAVDVFYVTERDGGPLTDAGKLSRLKASLLTVLVQDVAARPAA